MDEKVYLEKLSAFSRLLRLKGLTVSHQETADAARLLVELGLEDREMVKTALRTVYAKSREEQLTFDRVFDGFFLSEEAIRAQAKEQMERAREAAQRQEAARQDLERYGDPARLSEQERQAYTNMSEEARERLRGFMEKYKGTAERNPRLYGDFIHSVFARAIMEQQMLMEDAGAGQEGLDPELGMLYREISTFQDQEIPKAIDLIRKAAAQLNGDLSRRRGRRGRGAKLDFRRTIRKGLETGGSFYRLSYKRKPRRRGSLVLLCDVSGSMMQFSEFALRFIQALDQVSDSSHTFLFSEMAVEADPFKLQDMDLFRSFVKDSGIYGRGTDLGTALEQLLVRKPPLLGPSTTLLILSDTKTIDQPRALAALQEAKRRCGQTLLLNPIPQNKWKYLRSVQSFAAVATMVPCSTLGELTDACRRLTLS